MIIGIDIDGVVTDFPDFIRSITNSGDHKIIIITYRDDYNGVMKLLNNMNIKYDKINVAPNNVNMINWKVKIAVESKIDMMIDDSPEILNSMPPNIARIWVCSPEIYDLNKAIKGMKN